MRHRKVEREGHNMKLEVFRVGMRRKQKVKRIRNFQSQQ